MTDLQQIHRIDDLTTGRYILTTLSGTQHWLDLDGHIAIRIPAKVGHEWSGQDGRTPDGIPMHYATIRGYDLDTEEYEDHLEIGKHMRLDNSDEWRISTAIQKIEILPIEEQDGDM